MNEPSYLNRFTAECFRTELAHNGSSGARVLQVVIERQPGQHGRAIVRALDAVVSAHLQVGLHVLQLVHPSTAFLVVGAANQ